MDPHHGLHFAVAPTRFLWPSKCSSWRLAVVSITEDCHDLTRILGRGNQIGAGGLGYCH
jgi:hypothetical protein